MKMMYILCLSCILCGCVTTKTDHAIESIALLRSAQPEDRKNIDLIINGKKHSLEIIIDSNGSYIIPSDKVHIKYELRIE